MFSTPEEFAKKIPIKMLIQFREEPEVMSHDSYPECEPYRKRQAVRWECVPGAQTQQHAPLCVANASLEDGSSSLLHCAAPKFTNNIDQELQL